MTARQTATKKDSATKAKTKMHARQTSNPKASKTAARSPAKKLTALAAAAKVLREKGTPMTCQELIDAMAAKGYWKSPGGKTPASTLYAAIAREISTKGAESRFTKIERGKFSAAA
jgi:phage antirepressor YoqD-like protein